MQLSPEKTKYILPGGKVQEKEKVELYLAGQKLERAPQHHVKILGIPIHEDGGAATWLKELEPTWKKLLHLVKRISQKRGGAGADTARTLTSAVLTSRACYGAVCFDLTKAQYNKLERMHRECLRVITGLPRHARVEDLHRYAGLPPLRDIIIERKEGHDRRRRYTRSGQQLLELDGERLPNKVEVLPAVAPWDDVQVRVTKPVTRRQTKEYHGAYRSNLQNGLT